MNLSIYEKTQLVCKIADHIIPFPLIPSPPLIIINYFILRGSNSSLGWFSRRSPILVELENGVWVSAEDRNRRTCRKTLGATPARCHIWHRAGIETMQETLVGGERSHQRCVIPPPTPIPSKNYSSQSQIYVQRKYFHFI